MSWLDKVLAPLDAALEEEYAETRREDAYWAAKEQEQEQEL